MRAFWRRETPSGAPDELAGNSLSRVHGVLYRRLYPAGGYHNRIPFRIHLEPTNGCLGLLDGSSFRQNGDLDFQNKGRPNDRSQEACLFLPQLSLTFQNTGKVLTQPVGHTPFNNASGSVQRLQTRSTESRLWSCTWICVTELRKFTGILWTTRRKTLRVLAYPSIFGRHLPSHRGLGGFLA